MTKVLVVDDQPPNVRLLEAILTPRGYDVLTASSGEQALEVIAAEDVDLVLLDILMPGIDGYEVCRRIRDQVDTAYLPVVMVTASGDEQKVKALEAGADDFLSKPVNQSELLARVASLARIKDYQDTIKRQSTIRRRRFALTWRTGEPCSGGGIDCTVRLHSTEGESIREKAAKS